MKKILLPAILISAFTILCGAVREGAGKEQFTAQTDRLSVRLLLNEWRKGFAQNDFTPGLDRMRKEMLQDPQHNLSRAEAKKNAEKWFRDELRVGYSSEVEIILRPFAASFSPKEIAQFRSGETAFFEQRFRTLFESGFSKVRGELVNEQRKMVFRKIYPTVEELESMNDPQLSKVLMERFRKGLNVPLWEENVPLVQQQYIVPAIRSGRNQQKLQMTLLRRETVPASLWDAPAVESYLSRELERTLSLQVPDSAERYGFFPETKKQLRIRAERLPADRVIESLPRRLPADRYRTMLAQDPVSHKMADASFRLAAPEFQRYLLESAYQQAGVPEKFMPVLRKDPEVSKASAQRFRELTPQLQEIRNGFADEQLKKNWSSLVEGKWIPEMTETEAYAASDSKVIPKLKARPESVRMIHESEVKADQLIRKALAKEVQRREVQRKSIVEVYPAVLSAMVKLQEARDQKKNWFEDLFASGNITLDDVKKEYRKEVIAKSSAPLFPLVEKEIIAHSEKILRQVLNPVSGGNVVFELQLSGNDRELTLAFDNWKYSFRTREFSASGIEKEIRTRMAQENAQVFRIHLLVDGDRIFYSDAVRIRDALKAAFPECEFKDSLKQ